MVHKMLSYTAYGHGSTLPSSLTLLGFNGELFNGLQSGYLLGNGHRYFSPTLMRFQSPDSMSPFLAGGLNAYAYCGNDPINAVDPSGRTRVVITRTIRRKPFTTLVQHGPHNLVPIGATLVRDPDVGIRYYMKTWQPEPIIYKEILRLVKLDGSQGQLTGHVVEADFKAFKTISKEVKRIESSPFPLTEANTGELATLRGVQKSYLLEGGKRMNGALRDLGGTVTMTTIRRGEESTVHSNAQ